MTRPSLASLLLDHPFGPTTSRCSTARSDAMTAGEARAARVEPSRTAAGRRA